MFIDLCIYLEARLVTEHLIIQEFQVFYNFGAKQF